MKLPLVTQEASKVCAQNVEFIFVIYRNRDRATEIATPMKIHSFPFPRSNYQIQTNRIDTMEEH